MELRQMEALVLIAEGCSFSEAARRMGLTQPTVSAHIAALEEELGCRLLARSTRQTHLTPAGIRVYDSARKMVSLRDGILQDFQVRERQTVQVIVGASTIPSKYMLPELLAQFRQRQPDYSFQVVQGTSGEILEKVMSMEVQLGLVGLLEGQKNRACACVPIYTDRLVLVAPNTPHYRRLQREGAPLERLLEEPIILRESSRAQKKEVESYLESLGIPEEQLRVVARINDQETIKQAIRREMGVSIMPRKVVEEEAASGQLLTFALTEGRVERPIYLVYDRRRSFDRPVRSFLRFLEEYYHHSTREE